MVNSPPRILPNLMAGAALGATVMYIFDPHRGTRRRALVRDKAMRAIHETQEAIDAASRDLVHRAQGWVAEARHLFDNVAVDDDVLVARVRSRLGHLVSHPGLIEVSARSGQISLSGIVMEHEISQVLSVAKSVRGVSGVINRFNIRRAPDPERQNELRHTEWSPALRLISVIAGGVLIGTGIIMKGRAMLLSGVGASLVARGLLGELRRGPQEASTYFTNVIPISRPMEA